MKHIELQISRIQIGRRHRKTLGNVQELSESINAIGLLHRIVVSGDLTLIAGARRIAAYEALGRKTIPATILDNLQELDSALQAERDENIQRLDLAPSEAVSLGMQVETLASKAARSRQRSGKSYDGNAGGRGRRNLRPKLSQGFAADRRTSLVAAKAAGLSRSTYEKAKAVVQSGDSKLIARMDQTGKVSGHYKELQRRKAVAELVERNVSLPNEVRIEHCDMQCLDILPNSVDLIVADPPYDRSSVPLYGVLAERAASWLKPGGICCAYAGQLFLPEILMGMSEHLEWLWCFPVLHNGPLSTMRVNSVRQGWKPVIAFVKPPLNPWWSAFEDVVAAGKRDKSLHPWQQNEHEAAFFIEHLSPPNGLVVDPCLGSGTTAVAAARLGRRFIGCDVDPTAIEISHNRVGTLTTLST